MPLKLPSLINFINFYNLILLIICNENLNIRIILFHPFLEVVIEHIYPFILKTLYLYFVFFIIKYFYVNHFCFWIFCIYNNPLLFFIKY